MKLKNLPEIKIKNYQTTFAETSQVENWIEIAKGF
jgi:hypothetical protein